MKKHNFVRSLLASMLAFLMVFSTCSAAFAEVEDNTINYVSLGDSMTNGYGLAGYKGNNGVHDYGEVSYANQFAYWLVDEGYAETVNHAQLAMSGCRAEDYHWLLEFDHENEELRNFVNYISSGWTWNEEEWYSVFKIGDYRTWVDLCCDDNRSSAAASNILGYKDYDSPYATDGQKTEAQRLDNNHTDGNYVHYTNDNQVAIFAEYAQSAIKDADIISMSVGNSNFGTFMFDQIANAVGYSGSPDDAMKFSIERALTECPAKVKDEALKLLDELYAKVENYLGIELDYEDAVEPEDRMTAAVANAAVYAGISYVLNFAGTVDAILKLNQDVDIIMVGLMNTYLNTNQEITEPTIGSLLDVVFPPLNAFIAALPTIMQGAKNEVYKDANFYYAEAPEVACMVEVYGTDFYNEDLTANRRSITRQRFFRDLMGPIEQLFGESDRFGAPLDYTLTFPELCDYDDMTDTQKAAYAYEYKSKALTCAVYLAFEKATIIAGKEAPVTLESVMGLGNATDPQQFSGLLTNLTTNLAQSAPTYASVALSAIADVFNQAAYDNYNLISEITPQQVANIYGCPEESQLALATQYVAPIAEDERNDEAITDLALAGVYEIVYATYAQDNEIPYSWDDFKLYGGDSYTAFVTYVEANYWPLHQTTAIAQAKDTVVNESANFMLIAANYVDRLCQLLALPDALGDAIAEDDNATSWFGLLSRCVIGDGLGGHPSEAGHNALFNAVKSSYSEGYTAKDETLNNALILLEAVKGYIAEYYDEAYEYAYAETDANGYIDAAADAIDKAIKVISELDFSEVEMTDDFRAKLKAELVAVVMTLEEIKAVLEEDKASDVDGLIDSVTALWDDLNTHLTNAGVLLDQAEFDIKTLVVPVVDAYVSALVESFKDTAKTEIAKAGHKHYEATGGSKYVAIGGYTVYGTGLNLVGGEKTYASLIDSGYKPIVNPNGKLLPSGASALIDANKADIEQADLITYQLDASSFIDAILSLETLDWDNYLDAETKASIDKILRETEEVLTTNWTDYANAKIQEIIPEIKAEVMKKIPEDIPFVDNIFDAVVEFTVPYLKNAIANAEENRGEIASKIEAIDEVVWDYAEKLAYAGVSYAVDTKNAIEAIQAINPAATLVVVGMYNPARGLNIETGNGVIDAEKYVEYVIDATNIYYTALAVANGGFAFVDVSDASTNGFGGEVVSVDDIKSNASALYPNMHANAEGHAYIKEQIITAITCDYSVYEQLDSTMHTVKCSICGDADTEAHSFSGTTCTKCDYVKSGSGYTPPTGPTGSPSGGVSKVTYSVTFNTNGGSKIDAVKVKEGKILVAPKAPVKEGYIFDGWYADKELTQKYDFSTPVTKSFTLYAKWIDSDNISLKFTDVKKDAWYYDTVKKIVEKGLMNGISETQFAPELEVTRAMFVTILYRAAGEPQVATKTNFTDVSADEYYAKAVAWANANGIVKGITETEFSPNMNITREQMAAILYRYAKNEEMAEALTYADKEAISDYALDAVAWANAAGIMKGNTDGTFAPLRNASRAEAAAVFVRLLNL